MPFIGNKPSAVPLTSADITDSIITSAKIVDGTIVNADINASAAIAGNKLGAGAILQVIGATDTTARSTTSTSFVTGSNTLSVTITPSSASNKIAIFVTHYVFNSGSISWYTIYRDAINLGAADGFGIFNSASATQQSTMTYNYLDSPATTSATTYQVYMKTASNTAFMCEGSLKAQIICMEIKG